MEYTKKKQSGKPELHINFVIYVFIYSFSDNYLQFNCDQHIQTAHNFLRYVTDNDSQKSGK